MATLQDVRDFLHQAKTYHLATMDGDQPRVRPFGTAEMIDGKLIARPVTLSCGPALTLEGKIQVTVKRVEQDAFLSAYIHDNWKIGDQVETSEDGHQRISQDASAGRDSHDA